jgi:hypothetical protein
VKTPGIANDDAPGWHDWHRLEENLGLPPTDSMKIGIHLKNNCCKLRRGHYRRVSVTGENGLILRSGRSGSW